MDELALQSRLEIINVKYYCRWCFYRQQLSLYCSTFQVCDSPGNHWIQSTMQRTKETWRMGAAIESPLCATTRLTGHVDLLTKTRSPSVWVNAVVKHCSNTIFRSLLWCSSLKGNGLENLDVFKKQQRLQGHYTFLILLTSQLRQADIKGH